MGKYFVKSVGTLDLIFCFVLFCLFGLSPVVQPGLPTVPFYDIL